MVVNLRYSTSTFISCFLMAGCTFVEIPPTPREWGTKAGMYASEEWTKKNPNKYPTADSIAVYCVKISEDGQKTYDWTVAEMFLSTKACTKSFAIGLGLED